MRQPFDVGALAVPQRIVEQHLFGLGGRVFRIERLELPFLQGIGRPGRPRRRPRGQERLADGARLFLLALQFELAASCAHSSLLEAGAGVADGRAGRCVKGFESLVLGLQQLRRARGVGSAFDEEIALAVDRAEPCLFDLQQSVGEAVTACVLRKLVCRTEISREAGASSASSAVRQNWARTDAQEKKLGWTI